MLNHFEELCNLCAVSGDEGAVRDYVCRALEGNPTVSWQIDPLGNLLVEKKGAQRAPHHLMVSAHMDEVGLIVTHVQDGGLLEIAAVGGVDASVVIGRQFLVGRQHIPGIVGTKPVHLLSKEQRSQLPTFDGLVLDIGASSAEEARKLAPEGTCAYFCPYFRTLGDGRVCSKAIDDRAGCALLLGLLEQELPYDITAAFLVQEEIGLRGATAAAYTVAPEFALVLEATTAADIVGASGGERVCTLGGGPVISFMDRQHHVRQGHVSGGVCAVSGTGNSLPDQDTHRRRQRQRRHPCQPWRCADAGSFSAVPLSALAVLRGRSGRSGRLCCIPAPDDSKTHGRRRVTV